VVTCTELWVTCNIPALVQIRKLNNFIIYGLPVYIIRYKSYVPLKLSGFWSTLCLGCMIILVTHKPEAILSLCFMLPC